MKKLALLISSFMITLTATAYERQPAASESQLNRDLTSEIPEIDISAILGFEKVENVAQYKNADWSSVVGIARNIVERRARPLGHGIFGRCT